MNILLTGGIGYIGSHTVIELLRDDNNSVVVIDNLVNSRKEVKDTVEKITGKSIKFYEGDLVNLEDIDKVFKNEKIDAVIHFASLKAVGESVEKPLEYYNNNIIGTLNLLTSMRNHNVKKFIFSSSATVYGESEIVPVHEGLQAGFATNPYGRCKSMTEDILRDLYISDNSWDIVLLRYFNPVGAHESGLIGELPNGIPNNLMPYVSKVADGELDYVRVFGDDYNTPDGTGVRDYIHVVDLARGHVAAMKKLNDGSGISTYNLGTGQGYSVLDIIKAFSKASGKEIPYKIVDRRAGDIAISFADPSKAEKELGWKAEKNLEDMCKDFWKWQCVGMKNFK
ncbi:UDP-glucose 4-epimerase GalE [Clostridium perfringens]|uniref:UDP-glucose 4-epimerase GalE n=1 Tax=Clostridium perfringens TaxID=1502 RepID=UPI0039ECEA54